MLDFSRGAVAADRLSNEGGDRSAAGGTAAAATITTTDTVEERGSEHED